MTSHVVIIYLLILSQHQNVPTHAINVTTLLKRKKNCLTIFYLHMKVTYCTLVISVTNLSTFSHICQTT